MSWCRRAWRSSVISEEDLMDIRALSRQGYTYAEIGRILGRDWRTVRRYLEEAAQSVYSRNRMPSKLDPLKPVIDQWLAGEPRLLATRVHQDLLASRCQIRVGKHSSQRRHPSEPASKPPQTPLRSIVGAAISEQTPARL